MHKEVMGRSCGCGGLEIVQQGWWVSGMRTTGLAMSCGYLSVWKTRVCYQVCISFSFLKVGIARVAGRF